MISRDVEEEAVSIGSCSHNPIRLYAATDMCRFLYCLCFSLVLAIGGLGGEDMKANHANKIMRCYFQLMRKNWGEGWPRRTTRRLNPRDVTPPDKLENHDLMPNRLRQRPPAPVPHIKQWLALRRNPLQQERIRRVVLRRFVIKNQPKMS